MDEKLNDVQVRIVPIEHYAALMTRRKHIPLKLVSVPLLLVVIISSLLLYTGAIIHSKAAHVQRGQNGQSQQGAMATTGMQTQDINGASQWDEDTQVTAPTFDFPQSVPQAFSISSTFAPYYTAHSGTQSLGVPITAAFPTSQGWIQFFQWGALLSPSLARNSLHGVTDPLIMLASAGVRDLATGIIRLPLLQSLLTIGSQTPIVDNGSNASSLTFADVRQAMKPELMQPVSAANSTAATSPDGGQGTFIKTGTRAGTDVGFVIPQSIWNYIQRIDISPDGWNTDFGTPLTAVIPFMVTVHGNIHHMLVQLFWRDGIVVDIDSTNAVAGQPIVQRLATGLDYLRTVGPPAVMIAQQQRIWATGNTILYNAPSMSQAVAHVGKNFPLTLLGNTQWNKGMLWYHVQWSVGKQTAKGWLAASVSGFTSPGNVTPESSFDVLSPSLASYLNGIGSNVGAIVYDVTRQQYYSYNADTQFMVASSMKVPIMLTFLNMTEQQNRNPNDSEMQLLTTMIENSNNDSASALFSEVGNASGVDSYMQQLGIKDFSADDGSWGYSLITPRSMVKLLTLLQTGKILTAQDRQLALSLMEQVESDQQVGVGDTAPSGATVALKDGWVPAPDGSWVMNSSGIVTSGKETYIISVYTTEQNSLDDGQSISRKVCGTVASLLV